MSSTRYSTIQKIDDPGLRAGLNKYGGWILEIEHENPPATFELCGMFSGLIAAMIHQLDPWLTRRELVRPIHAGFLHYTEPGGFAGIASIPAPYEFIAISHGTIAEAMDRFNRIFAHPDNFPDVGVPSKEQAPAIIKLSDHPLQHAEWWWWGKPACGVRRRFAEILSMVCLEMAALHEYSHLANGHVAYLNELGNPDDPLLKQTLEMDADATALFLSVQLNRLRWIGLQSLGNDDPDLRSAHHIAFGSPRRFYMTILIAGYTFFRMFDKPWNRNSQATGSHPQYAFRMKALADGLRENLHVQPTPHYSPEQFRLDAGRVFCTVDRAFGLMTGTEPSREMFDSVFNGSASAEYFYDLERNWAEISPAVAKHMKVAGLSPVDWSRIPDKQ